MNMSAINHTPGWKILNTPGTLYGQVVSYFISREEIEKKFKGVQPYPRPTMIGVEKYNKGA